MVTLILRFPGRRYHATPWGHHVNEGLIEWPPSPWRLLRALLATGYATLHWPGDGPPTVARSLIEKLAAVLPRYRLPHAAGAHSRHYMPLARFKNGREDTTLVFDTWAQVDDSVLTVSWGADLSADENALMGQLAERLGYLGRSESWVSARLANVADPLPLGDECFPCARGESPGRGWEQVALMAPLEPREYSQWRAGALAAELRDIHYLDEKNKKLTKEERKILARRREIENQFPADTLGCLQVTTAWLRKLGWSQPPGSQRVLYWRPSDALESGAPRSTVRGVAPAPVEAMLLAMATLSGNNHALPAVTRTLPQAELLHRALVHAASRDGRKPGKVLTGCDETEKPLREPHRHAHLLPLDLDGDGHLDHILIWAPMGLDAGAQTAVRAVRQTFTKGGVGALRLAIAACGDVAELSSVPGPIGDQLHRLFGPVQGAKHWTSSTPFIPPRYTKKRGRNSLEGQVRAELASRGYPEATEIVIRDPRVDTGALRMRHFVRVRRHGPQPPIDYGFALTLRFRENVRGPLCLGYGSHYGLGMFISK